MLDLALVDYTLHSDIGGLAEDGVFANLQGELRTS